MNQETTQPWDRINLQNPHQLEDKKQRVQTMFSSVAKTYDMVNRVLSLNMDVSWRKKAVQIAEIQPNFEIVDICCGTGDMALTFAESTPRPARIVGVDFVQPMLDIAHQKQTAPTRSNTQNIEWICSDAENIHMLEGNQFDRSSCVFGLRNLQNPQKGLDEMYRLVKPGGKSLILEFDMPRNRFLRFGYECYFRLILPIVGSLLSQDSGGAYYYLPQSVRSFDTRKFVESGLYQAGFSRVQIIELNLGSVLLFVAEKND